MTAPVLMVQGTASSAGKSTLVAGLCRLFARRGVRVAPFKAQNMSNNAAVCPGGGEIGRAQYAQAVAAGVEPSVALNPILLKPQAGGCQVVVNGRVWGAQTAAEYFGDSRPDLWPVVTDALDRLRERYDLVIAEGAGSPAEINLRDRDLANMRVALHARADVLLVADVDRGGAFGALLGTWEWLEPDERALVRGFVLNKFRGDPSLLAPAPSLLETRTGAPVLGVIPYLDDLAVPEEDAASLSARPANAPLVQVAVIRLPHLANFDEFEPLAGELGVEVRYVTRPEELRAPDLVILPGTKATIPDLLWLHERGLAGRIRWLAEHRTPVLGVCGGFQMLGTAVEDPERHESPNVRADGLGLLPASTVLTGDKRLVRSRGRIAAIGPGPWEALSGLPVEGYEIHQGRTTVDGAAPFLEFDGRSDGVASPDGLVAGTYLHGLLENRAARHTLLRHLAATRGFTWRPDVGDAVDSFDRLADVLERSLTLDPARLPSLAALPRRQASSSSPSPAGWASPIASNRADALTAR